MPTQEMYVSGKHKSVGTMNSHLGDIDCFYSSRYIISEIVSFDCFLNKIYQFFILVDNNFVIYTSSMV